MSKLKTNALESKDGTVLVNVKDIPTKADMDKNKLFVLQCGSTTSVEDGNIKIATNGGFATVTFLADVIGTMHMILDVYYSGTGRLLWTGDGATTTRSLGVVFTKGEVVDENIAGGTTKQVYLSGAIVGNKGDVYYLSKHTATAINLKSVSLKLEICYQLK